MSSTVLSTRRYLIDTNDLFEGENKKINHDANDNIFDLNLMLMRMLSWILRMLYLWITLSTRIRIPIIVLYNIDCVFIIRRTKHWKNLRVKWRKISKSIPSPRSLAAESWYEFPSSVSKSKTGSQNIKLVEKILEDFKRPY